MSDASLTQLPEDECLTCTEPGSGEPNECPKSLRPCGHHCNHLWEQDCCHWCGAELGEDENGDFSLFVIREPAAVAEGTETDIEALTESTGDGETIHGDFLFAEAIDAAADLPEGGE